MLLLLLLLLMMWLLLLPLPLLPHLLQLLVQLVDPLPLLPHVLPLLPQLLPPPLLPLTGKALLSNRSGDVKIALPNGNSRCARPAAAAATAKLVAPWP